MVSDPNYQRMQARKIMARVYGEDAIYGKIVHHKDGNPWNNNFENLEIVTKEEHKKLHPGHWREKLPNGDTRPGNRPTIIKLNLPEDLREKLRIRAWQERTNMTGLLIRMIEERLEQPVVIRVP